MRLRDVCTDWPVHTAVDAIRCYYFWYTMTTGPWTDHVQAASASRFTRRFQRFNSVTQRYVLLSGLGLFHKRCLFITLVDACVCVRALMLSVCVWTIGRRSLNYSCAVVVVVVWLTVVIAAIGNFHAARPGITYRRTAVQQPHRLISLPHSCPYCTALLLMRACWFIIQS